MENRYSKEHFLKHLLCDWGYEVGIIEPIPYSISIEETVVTLTLPKKYEHDLTEDQERVERHLYKCLRFFQKITKVVYI